MKRFVWIAVIFGGGVATLMVASLILQHQAGSLGVASPEDLKTSVKALRQAFAEWDYEKVTRHTSDMPQQAFQKVFDDAHSGDPARTGRFTGVLSAMDVFPSVRFSEVRPERADVSYETWDGPSGARPSTSFVWGEKGWFMRVARFPVASTDNTTGTPIVFHEGDNVALGAAVDKLLDTLAGGSPEDFRSLMMLDDNTPMATVMQHLDDVRAQVLTCRADRLKKLVPRVGPLSRGTRWLHLLVIGEVDKKKLWLDMEVVCGSPARFRSFRAGVVKEREPVNKPPPTPPMSVPGP